MKHSLCLNCVFLWNIASVQYCASVKCTKNDAQREKKKYIYACLFLIYDELTLESNFSGKNELKQLASYTLIFSAKKILLEARKQGKEPCSISFSAGPLYRKEGETSPLKWSQHQSWLRMFYNK